MTTATKLDRAIEKLGKKRAFNLLHAHMANVSAGIEKPKQDISFQEFVDKWRTTVLPTFKPSTQTTTKSHLGLLVNCWGALPIAGINSELVQQWVSSQAGSPKTVINILTTLKQLFRSANEWNYLQRNQIAGIKLPKRGLISSSELTPLQALAVIRKAEEPYKTLFWIVAETGMRGGEVCGLFVDDVDFDRQMIHVRRSAWRGQLQTPKSGNAVRSFPISSSLMNVIRDYVHNNERNGLLFTSVSGRPLDNGLVVRDVLRPILKQAGIYKQGMGLHAFRHMNLSVMGSLGVPAKVVQERAGHASYSTSLGYMSGQSKDHQSIAEQLGQMFDPKMEDVA